MGGRSRYGPPNRSLSALVTGGRRDGCEAGCRGRGRARRAGSRAGAARRIELSETQRLQDRREVAAGTRAQVLGFQDGRFYANGWHTTGEMGGIITPPLKLLDSRVVRRRRRMGRAGDEVHGRLGLRALRAAVDRRAPAAPHRLRARRRARRAARARADEPRQAQAHRDGDGRRALRADDAVPVGLRRHDAERERQRARPRRVRPRQRSCSATPGSCRARRPTTPTRRSSAPTGGAASGETGAGPLRPVRRGPRCRPRPDGPRRCRASATTARSAAAPAGSCATGSSVKGRGSETLWIAVAGSENSAGEARTEFARLTHKPERAARREAAPRAARSRAARASTCPATGSCRSRSSGASRTSPTSPRRRRTSTSAGRTRARSGRPRARWAAIGWVGAGFPDYPWLFARRRRVHRARQRDARAVRGDQGPHARAARRLRHPQRRLRAWSCTRSSPDGSVWYGKDPRTPTRDGTVTYDFNTDEIVKFPGAVALIWRWTGDDRFRDEMLDFTRRNLEYVRDAARRGPRRLARGQRQRRAARAWARRSSTTPSTTSAALYDYADMARSAGQAAERGRGRGARRRARRAVRGRVVDRGRGSSTRTRSTNPGNDKINQKHWIGVDPMEVELLRRRRGRARARHVRARLGGARHAREQLLQRRAARQPRPVPHRLRRRSDRGGRVRDLLAQHRASRPSARATTAASAPSSSSATRTPTRRRSSPSRRPAARRTSSRARCRRSCRPSRRPTPRKGPPARRRTSTAAGPAARCSCRPGATTAPHGRSSTSSSACGRSSATTGSRWSRRCPTGSRASQGADIRLGGRGSADVLASADGDRYTTVTDTDDVPLRTFRIGHTLPRGATVASVELDGHAVTDYDARQDQPRPRGLASRRRPGRRHTLVVTAG